MKLANKNILLIDDTHAIHTFLRISLETLGANFQGTATAAGGLALCETMQPDLVILDLSLPDNEGLNILPRLKRLHKEKHLPVIVLTAHKEQEMLSHAMETGADAYITKPFIVGDLLQVIYDQLGIRNKVKLSLV